MNDLKAYYAQQEETQPEPNLAVQPAAATVRKPRVAVRRLGLVAASLAVVFAASMAIPSVRAAVIEFIWARQVVDLVTGEVSDWVYTGPLVTEKAQENTDAAATEETQENSGVMPAGYLGYSKVFMDVTHRYFRDNAEGYAVVFESIDKSNEAYLHTSYSSHRIQYDSVEMFWDAIENVGHLRLSEDFDDYYMGGSVGYRRQPNDTLIHSWEESGIRISVYDTDKSKIGICHFTISTEAGSFHVMMSVDAEFGGIFANETTEPVKVEGWDTAFITRHVKDLWSEEEELHEGWWSLYVTRPLPEGSILADDMYYEERKPSHFLYQISSHSSHVNPEQLIEIAEAFARA
jgi:hypothetical protein